MSDEQRQCNPNEDFIQWYKDKGMPNKRLVDDLYRADGFPCGKFNRATLRTFVDYIKGNEEVVVGNRKPRILFFDIESTGLRADFGIMTMFAYRWEHEDEIKVRTLLDTPECMELPPEKRDKFIIMELCELINEADVVVAHYGSKFDCPFVQTRALMHGLPVIDVKWAKILDPCITARKKLKFQSNRMDNIAEALGVGERKSSVPKNIWYRSHTFDGHWYEDAIRQLAVYCIQDVNVLYHIAKVIAPLAIHLPAWRVLAGAEDSEKQCANVMCGGKLEFKGISTTKANKYPRYRCTECGMWQRGVVPLTTQKPNNRTMY